MDFLSIFYRNKYSPSNHYQLFVLFSFDKYLIWLPMMCGPLDWCFSHQSICITVPTRGVQRPKSKKKKICIQNQNNGCDYWVQTPRSTKLTYDIILFHMSHLSYFIFFANLIRIFFWMGTSCKLIHFFRRM